jgi:phenylpyruvate tautomerase PptA (4-oxalocrotonate tautomerase family)
VSLFVAAGLFLHRHRPHRRRGTLHELALRVSYQDGELREVAVIMCDIRRGRDAAQRERLARDLVVLIARATRLPEQQIVVEFTQHEPSEMFRYGALAPEWDADEAER